METILQDKPENGELKDLLVYVETLGFDLVVEGENPIHIRASVSPKANISSKKKSKKNKETASR